MCQPASMPFSSLTDSHGRNNLDAKKNAKKRKASEMEGIESSPSAAKKRAKPTPRVTKGRVKGEHHTIKTLMMFL
jgi:hypothetical protein